MIENTIPLQNIANINKMLSKLKIKKNKALNVRIKCITNSRLLKSKVN